MLRRIIGFSVIAIFAGMLSTTSVHVFGQNQANTGVDPYYTRLQPVVGNTQVNGNTENTANTQNIGNTQARSSAFESRGGEFSSSQRQLQSNASDSQLYSLNVDPSTAAEIFEPGKVLAIVGGDPIFMGDMAFEIQQLLDRFMPSAPDAVKDQQRSELAKRLINKYVDSRLLYIDVKKRLPDQVDVKEIRNSLAEQFDTNVVQEMAKKVNVSGAIMLDGYLRSRGSSLRQVREAWITDAIVKYFLPQQHQFDKEVTHDELIEYYREHINEFEIKAKAKWEQVMVRFDRFNNRDEAAKAIQVMGDQIYYGATWEAVAKRASHGINAPQGGQYDWTHRGSLTSSEIDKAIFQLPLNRMSEIIETDQGLHIVRVKQRVEQGFVPFVEAQVKIKEQLKTEKRDAELQKHLAKIRKEIPFEILIESLDPGKQ
jgi:parvulin-like peptidyl-prolyl isomerase